MSRPVWYYSNWTCGNLVCRRSRIMELNNPSVVEELICHLYKQFIHEVTVQNMVTSYQKTMFSKTTGALAYYNELKHHASRMVQPPDEYSMKRKFLGGLPDDLIENLFKSRRVTAEHTSIDKLVREVKAMESSIQAI